MERNLDTFLQDVTKEKNPDIAALDFINGIIDRLRAAGSDLNRVAWLVAELEANKGAFAQGITANTVLARPALVDVVASAPVEVKATKPEEVRREKAADESRRDR